MPALSPTMTEGNIASWRLKEGDSFSAGDVLLEIETDKATMDVEAQDEGVVFRIMMGDGSKGVKVGNRIAVFAEEGDDLGSLEVPAEGKKSSEGGDSSKDASQQKPQENVTTQESSRPKPSAAGQGGRAQKQSYPLYPAVQALLRQNGLSKSDSERIPASGPKGRLLKGDVLAFLGQIGKEYPMKSSERLAKLTHLDLSNIQIAEAAPAPEKQVAAPKQTVEEVPELPKETEMAVPISLAAVAATQERLQNSLGISLARSAFISRASEIANEDLPPRRNQRPTSDDLFNAVLGLNAIPKPSRGHFAPRIFDNSLPTLTVAPTIPKQADIIDLLGPQPRRRNPSKATSMMSMDSESGDQESILSVTARRGEEKRATKYLERMKVILEEAPGRFLLSRD